MKTKIKSISLIAVLSLLSVTAYADNSSSSSSSSSPSSSSNSANSDSSSSSSNSSFVGNYQCARTDASGTNNYSLAITNNGKTLGLEWDNANGYPVLYGTGLMHPSKNNVLSVSFTDPKNTDNYGVELFEMKSDGSLSSAWAVQSANTVGTDTCTKGK